MNWEVYKSICHECDKPIIGFAFGKNTNEVKWWHIDGRMYRHIITPALGKTVVQAMGENDTLIGKTK